MKICPINNIEKNPGFGHNNPWADSPYNNTEKYIVAGTTALGVLCGMAANAKYKGYSLSPKRMFKNIGNSYINKVKYDDGPVITIGAGSCLGGLAGGFIIDKDKENRKAKMREAFLQMTNISLPIIFTVWASRFGHKVGNKYWDKCRKETEETFRTKIPQGIAAITGLVSGVYTANVVANKINEKIFHQGKGRPVQLTDFSAHLDDFCIAGTQITSAHWIDRLARFVPAALLIAGNEVGNTSVENADS
jgi:hypothetical protein